MLTVDSYLIGKKNQAASKVGLSALHLLFTSSNKVSSPRPNLEQFFGKMSAADADQIARIVSEEREKSKNAW